MVRRLPVLGAALGVVLAGGLLLLPSFGDGEPPATPSRPSGPPSDAEARAALAEQVAALKADPTVEAYCGSDDFCLRHWQEAGGTAAIPPGPPHVLLSRESPPFTRVLVVCGRDGLGRPYRSDFPVSRPAAKLEAWLTVFWANTRYDGYKPEGPVTITGSNPPTAPASNPPECG